jgi:hypothetical protein
MRCPFDDKSPEMGLNNLCNNRTGLCNNRTGLCNNRTGLCNNRTPAPYYSFYSFYSFFISVLSFLKNRGIEKMPLDLLVI